MKTFVNVANKTRMTCSKSLTSLCGVQRNYHTYPAPDEKPILTKFKSSTVRQEKKGKEFDVNELLKMESNIAPTATNAADATVPVFVEHSSQLSNGIRVVSQDTTGLMTSFSFTVGSGR